MFVHARGHRYLVCRVDATPAIDFVLGFQGPHPHCHFAISIPEEVQGAKTPFTNTRFNKPSESWVDSEVDGHDAERGIPFVVLGVSDPIVISGLEAAEAVGEILSKMCNITDAAKPRSVGQPDREILE